MHRRRTPAFAAPPVWHRGAVRSRGAPSACAASKRDGKKFKLCKAVMPADTDYSGALWHGSYVRYLEEARVEYLSWVGIPYGELVRDHRIELVVTELSVRYRQPARLGDRLDVSVLLDLERAKGVRIPLHSALTRDDGAVLATADVTLAPINADSGRLLRRLPPRVRTAIFEPYEGDADSPLEEDMVRSSPAMNSI